MNEEYIPFSKIPRLNREIIISEKIDGTCSLVEICDDGSIRFGSKNRWLDEHNDNHGFWRWCSEYKKELLKLGVGRHHGEWYGSGIQRSYGLKEKRFALFNAGKWINTHSPNITSIYNPLPDKMEFAPKCCWVVPIFYKGPFSQEAINDKLKWLKFNGSEAVKGFMRPEGIIIYHTAANHYFKITCEKDDKPKGSNEI